MHRTSRDIPGSERELVLTLVGLYCRGVFPMHDPRSKAIQWYSADPRALIPIDDHHLPRSVLRALRRGGFRLTSDRDFSAVIRGCAERRHRRESPSVSTDTWIDGTIIEWFEALHRHGFAHSVEAWRTDPESGEERLVGGIYGASVGAAFFAESMFHAARPRLPGGRRHPLDGTSASNVCLAALLGHLRTSGYRLFDVQFSNPHVARFGVREVPHGRYLRLLDDAVAHPSPWHPL